MMLILFFVLAQSDAEHPPRFTLDQVIEQAQQRPQLTAAALQTEAARAEADAVAAQLNRPHLDAALRYQYQDPVPALVTPIGTLEQGDRHSGVFQIEARQALIDIAGRGYSVPALRNLAEARGHNQNRVRLDLIQEAALAFVQSLRYEAQLRSIETFIQSLTERAQQVQAQVDAGRALQSDLLKISLRREDAKLTLIRLQNAYAVSQINLGRTLGLAGPAQPRYERGQFPRALPAKDDAVRLAQKQRPELQALARQQRALTLQAQAVRADRLPRLDARLALEAMEPSPFSEDRFATAQLVVRQRLFRGGARKHQAAAKRMQAQAVSSGQVEQKRRITLELEAAYAAWRTAITAIRVRKLDVTQATETLRVEAERYQSGRATLNDVLDFEAVLNDRRTLADLAELDLLTAWIQYARATASF
ncbi:TolC family protein [Acanthopleuribacter pedis]|uniref:TolC family protein n=1 Tax=Acanthopleuribacter pedis TaxID=442870 RepID=A0A8J7QE08_9BACT|nr:TolC family protein [Acanthopleuribacter pedis]MBO1319241.1 TolC family protein [Acanthopleuribacter pedis]